jgi:hypothetical protein
MVHSVCPFRFNVLKLSLLFVHVLGEAVRMSGGAFSLRFMTANTGIFRWLHSGMYPFPISICVLTVGFKHGSWKINIQAWTNYRTMVGHGGCIGKIEVFVSNGP